MILHISQVIAESLRRGRGFALEVLRGRGGPEVTIEERDWLIACDRWPDDPALKTGRGGALERKCC